MKSIIVGILIYLSGCVTSYFELRYHLTTVFTERKLNVPWSEQDRAFAIAISSGSWFTVVATTCLVIGHKLPVDDKAPARW